MTASARGAIYFQGFNALRFYAALSVIVQHVSYSPHDWFGVPLLPVTWERFFLTGSDAVNLFFVLSGFLITYLLLNERERTGAVSIRNFYIRRAFRIYPVYFLYLFGVIALLQPGYSPELLFLLIFFMGNAAFVLFFPFPPFDHLWSIGVEEQYYLLAPALARYRAHALKIVVAVIAGWWALLAISTVLPPSALTAFVQMSRYDLIALGALTAYAYHHQWNVLRVVGRRSVLFASLLIILYAVIVGSPPSDAAMSTIVGLAFAVLIYHLASSRHVPKLLQNPRAEYLGHLSYSMYVYHPLFVLLFHTLFYHRLNLGLYQLVAYPAVIVLTLGTSWISYEKLERFFLAKKDRFRSRRAALPERIGESAASAPELIATK